MRLAFAVLLVGCGSSVASSEDAAVDSTGSDSAVIDSNTTDARVDSSSPDTLVDDTPVRDSGFSAIAITGTELSPWEGKTIWFIIQNRGPMPGEIARASTKIVGGVATLTIPDAMPRDHFGVGVNVFIDLDADKTCNGADPVWFDIATNMIGKSESPYAFKPSVASKITCSEIGK